MSSAAFVRQRALRNFSVFYRNFCSKGDELDLPNNFKYPTKKLVENEPRKSWKNRWNDDRKADYSRRTYPNNDREIQKWKTGTSSAERTLDISWLDDVIPEKSANNVKSRFTSQDLMEVANESTIMKRIDASKQLVRIERDPNSKVKSKIAGEVLYGINPVSMALNAKRRSFFRLFVKRNSNDSDRISAVRALAESMNVPVVKVDVNTLDEMSGSRPHQGVCLDAGMLFFESDEWNGSSDVNAEPLYIFMDKIQDPMNLGAILRSCYYFGIRTVFTVKKQTCKLTPVVSKASSGAMEMMNVYAVEDPLEFLKAMIKEGRGVIGSASADALDRTNLDPCKIVNLKEFVWPKPTILLVGNEGGGIDTKLIKFCSQIITISNNSSSCPDMMSLNVSVATGIILHSCSSQLLHSENGQPNESLSITAAE